MSRHDPVNGHLSVSQLGTLESCSLDWRLQKLDRVPQRTAAWFTQGTAVHAAVEAYERHGRALLAVDILNAYDRAWDEALAEQEAKQPSEAMWMVGGRKSRQQDIEQRSAKGRQQVIEYVELHPKNDEWKPFEIIPDEYSVEVGFNLDFNGVEVLGYIDLIEENQNTGELRVVDIKTGTKLPSDPYQMGTYAVAVEQILGVRPVSGGWWMCVDAQLVPFDLTPYTADVVAEWYAKADQTRKKGPFIAKPDGTCFTCTSRAYCPTWPGALPIPRKG